MEGMVEKKGLILDLGCGIGWCVRPFSRLEVVIGLDMSKSKLRIAKRNYKEVELILGDAQHLPFRSESFNVIVMKDVLEHIPNDQETIDEVYQICKYDAEVIIYVPISLEETTPSIEAFIHRLTGYTIDSQVGHIRRYTVHNITEMLKVKGFQG
jgi:ubiquinone/menaquinone biosynthesis C-methylase UbiE